MNRIFVLLETATKLVPSEGAAKAAEVTAAAKTTTGGFLGASGNPVIIVLVYCLVIFGAMYFFSVRPARKKEARLSQMRDAVVAGDYVLLNNGMFGKVTDITAECFIIEFGTNKSVRIPVLKQEVLGKREPNLTNRPEEVVQEEPKGLGGLFGNKDKSDEPKE